MNFNFKYLFSILLLVISMNTHASCSTCVVNPEDPYEEVNKLTFYFNHAVFALYVKPATVIYNLFPLPAKESANNFIQNMRATYYAINSFLQGEMTQGAKTTLRFVVNSTLGLAGLFDPASEMGLPEHKATVGDTLYAWGWKESSYLVVPLVGPSTIRDAWGIAGDYFMSPPAYFPPDIWNPYYLLVLVNQNYQAKDIQDLVSIAGVNDYYLVRSSYLQHRHYELTGEIAPLQGGVDLEGPPD